MALSYSWLGVAGVEIRCEGAVLLVDPFFTRPPAWAVLSNRRMPADQALAARCAPRADFVLVTHPHYDHLMDVPAVLQQTGARAFGSPNTVALLSLHGFSSDQVGCIKPGDRLDLGPFRVDVFPAWHTSTPLNRWLNGPLPARLALPLRMFDYRMDACYCFRIQAGEHNLLVGNLMAGSRPVPADTLFLTSFLPDGLIKKVLHAAQGKRVVITHWDIYTRPLSRPLRSLPAASRLHPATFARRVQALAPGCEVVIPELFQRVDL